MHELLKKINIKPKNINIYETALTHSSYANEHQENHYERLEFLGDAILQLIISEYLFEHDDNDEGVLTKKRAQTVREESLCLYAEALGLSNYIRLGRGESEKGANASIVADVFESLIAAIYLDLGYEDAKRVVLSVYKPLQAEVSQIKDYKSQLQEFVAVDRKTLTYRTKYKGPSNQREFYAEVYLENDILLGKGFGHSKKEAEQKAAKEALSKLA